MSEEPDDQRREQDSARPPEIALPDPADLVEPDDALPEVTLAELSPALREATARAGWTRLMPVQAKAIPYLLAGRDLMIQSRTGSGKTGAFLLPMLERLDPSRATCQAMVIVPTRELAQQVKNHAEILFGEDGIHAVAVYGGVAYGPQIDGFNKGAHLVVGTPGRVLDHLIKRTLKLDDLDVIVLDEADRMLSMGFYPDMKRLKEFLPESRSSGWMFSATFPAVVMSVAGEFLEQPEFLSLSRDKIHVAETEHVFYDVPAMEKDRYLMRIIEIENPSSAIIFCNTKADTRYVSIVLQRFGYDADELSSDISQGAREKVLDRVREGKLRFLVATDVAARGIDIAALSHVIQYGPPKEPEAYIHRVGRTSRAGATGEALTLVSGLERAHLKYLGKRFGIDLQERQAPTEEEVQEIVAERLTVLLEARLRDRSSLKKERMQRFLPLVRRLGDNDDAAALVAMLLDDYYQQSLHAPPTGEVVDPTAVEREIKARDRDRRGSREGGRGRSGGGRKRRRRSRRGGR